MILFCIIFYPCSCWSWCWGQGLNLGLGGMGGCYLVGKVMMFLGDEVLCRILFICRSCLSSILFLCVGIIASIIGDLGFSRFLSCYSGFYVTTYLCVYYHYEYLRLNHAIPLSYISKNYQSPSSSSTPHLSSHSSPSPSHGYYLYLSPYLHLYLYQEKNGKTTALNYLFFSLIMILIIKIDLVRYIVDLVLIFMIIYLMLMFGCVFSVILLLLR